MTPKPFLLISILSLTLIISSCKMYYIPVDSFKQQMPSIETVNLKQVTTKDPWGHKETYSTYPIDSIKCFDKDGTTYKLKNSPSIEIRFTYDDNRRTTFYFDRIWVVKDSVTGIRSHFLIMKKSIPLNTVKLIEVQDGHKKYRYVN